MPRKQMWVPPSAATAREEVEDITLIIINHTMPFPCLISLNRILQQPFNYFLICLEKREPTKKASQGPCFVQLSPPGSLGGGTMVQSSGWNPYAPYSALGDPIKTSPCSNTSSSEGKLHHKGKMSLIISASAQN